MSLQGPSVDFDDLFFLTVLLLLLETESFYVAQTGLELSI